MAFLTYPLNFIDYDAADAETWLCTRDSGIFYAEDFPYSVTGSDTSITIGAGLAWIHNSRWAGKAFKNDSPITLDLGVSNSQLDRIDVVAIQFDAVANATNIVVKHGTASSRPSRPAISQTESLYELYLCSIRRKAGTSTVKAADITDLRLSNLCGLMADPVTSIDTDAIDAQVTELIDKLEDKISNAESGAAYVLRSGDTMTGALTVPVLTVNATDSYPAVELSSGNNVKIGALQASGVTRRVYIVVAPLGSQFVENFRFPAPDTNITENKNYDVLTSKSVVTVAQGGTGAASPSGARSALGVPPTNHASSTTTYGTGSSSLYGHLRLSSSVANSSGVGDGIAATPAAVKTAYDAAKGAASIATNAENAAAAAAAGLPAASSGDGSRDTTNTTYANTQLLQWRKWGRTVTVNLYLRLSGTINSDPGYVRIASGFPAPPINYKGFFATMESESTPVFASINTSGEITLFLGAGQKLTDDKGYVYCAFTYTAAS